MQGVSLSALFAAAGEQLQCYGLCMCTLGAERERETSPGVAAKVWL